MASLKQDCYVINSLLQAVSRNAGQMTQRYSKVFSILTVLIVPGLLFSLAQREAKSSVLIDVDRKLMIYANDGDGMQYILVGGKKKSVRYSEENKYPLGSSGQLRYSLNKDREIQAILEKPGRPGLTSSRPITDLEVARANQTLLAITQALGASSLAISSDADLGPVVDSFDVLRGKDSCKLAFHEKGIDVCGERFGRQGVVNWTMFNDRLCGAFNIWCIGSYRFNIGYQSLEGRKAVSIEIVNDAAAQRFVQVFSSWSGTVPQRI
jgi:hypothetical protein